MIGRLKRWLKAFRYYSAGGEDARWATATDVAFLVAMVLALPAVFIAETVFVRSSIATSYGGMITQMTDGSFIATAFAGKSGEMALTPFGGVDIAAWNLTILDEAHGWPVVTRVDRPQATMDINVYAEMGVRENVQLAADDPWRVAIDVSLDENGYFEAQETWNATGVTRNRYLAAWMGNGMLWWVMLAIAGIVLVQISRVILFGIFEVRRLRRLNREVSGMCPKCGYDMRGLDFNERCPECGSLVY